MFTMPSENCPLNKERFGATTVKRTNVQVLHYFVPLSHKMSVEKIDKGARARDCL